MNDLLKKHPLSAFFILAFFLSWLAGFPSGFLPKWPGILTLLMSFMPAIAAIIIVYLVDGKQQLITLLSSLKKFRIRWYWYIFVLIFPTITMFVTIFIFCKTNKLSLDASFPLFHLNFSHILFLVGILFYQLVIVWGEELGWRGRNVTIV